MVGIWLLKISIKRKLDGFKSVGSLGDISKAYSMALYAWWEVAENWYEYT